MSEQKKRRNTRNRGYVPKSPGVCVVVHDPTGAAMSDTIANEVVNSIFEIAQSHGYLINFTRT